MRLFYLDEGVLDTLLQIADGPVQDGNLVSKQHRSEFVKLGWVVQCEGYNIITQLGRQVISTLRLCRMVTLPVRKVEHVDGYGSKVCDSAGPFTGIVSASDEAKCR